MTRRAVLLTMSLFAFGAERAWAHDGHVHTIRGTITARHGTQLSVRTPSGETLSIAMNEKTSVVRGKHKVTLDELKVGVRVVVDIGNGQDPLTAGMIQLGTAQPPIHQ